jgi:hypothetical protein
MAIYEIPSYSLVECTFLPANSVGRARIGGGVAVSLTETMETVFRVQIETIPLNQAARQAWHAWRAKLRGGLDMFSLYDVTKRNPLNYPTAAASTDISGSWDGTADVTSLAASGVLGLASLPAGYVLSAGDYIGLEESSRYDLYTVASNVTANGSGVASVSVLPYLRTGIFTTAAVARIWRPKATFVFEPESWSESAGLVPSSIAFTGIQRI